MSEPISDNDHIPAPKCAALAVHWAKSKHWRPGSTAASLVLAASNQVSEKVRDMLLGLARDRASRQDLDNGWLIVVAHGSQVLRVEKYPLSLRHGRDAEHD